MSSKNISRQIMLYIATCLLVLSANSIKAETIYGDDFEAGRKDWGVDNGVWEVGPSIYGCHEGEKCAGTVLDGNYPDYSDTRLISPYIELPTIRRNEKLILKLSHIFRLRRSQGSQDKGLIQVDLNDGYWRTIYGPFSGVASEWTEANIDLSIYSGKTVRIGFLMISDGEDNDIGWHIDNIRVEKVNTEDTNSDISEFIKKVN